jgi:hypothetical protein
VIAEKCHFEKSRIDDLPAYDPLGGINFVLVDDAGNLSLLSVHAGIGGMAGGKAGQYSD